MNAPTPLEAATPLQAARFAHDWKQSRTILALQRQAEADGLVVAEPKSLKAMLSTWENGRSQPGPMYRKLFCAIYGQSETELGFIARGPERKATISPVMPSVGLETVDYFHNVYQQHLQADSLLGPHHLVDVVRAQTTLLDQLLPSARGDVHDQLLLLACNYNEFTGWLYQDAGDPDTAMTYSDRAVNFAAELDDPHKRAYLLMRKCNIAIDQDKPDRAISLSEAALRRPTAVPPRVQAVILAQRARAYAALGKVGGCARALEEAYQQVTLPEAENDTLAGFCNESYILMEAAACWSRLGEHDKAVPIFEQSLIDWPTAQRRDQGLCRARLALTYAARGDWESACAAGREAVSVVQSATSVRALHELHRLRTRLAPWRKDAEVSALAQQLTLLIGA